MDLTPDNPVTLVVKAPNQRIADQTIECMLEWTVKKLKEHLSSVYPSQPQETEQKLIYSGKLLQDHLTLKDILRQYGEEAQHQHTVHLVCAPTSEGVNMTTDSVPVDTMVNNPFVAPPMQAQGFTTEGLRYRGSEANPVYAQSPTNMAHGYEQPSAVWNHYMQQAMAQNPAMAYMAYNPQQYMYMQQMYSQYMAQYMQYYQSAPEVTQPVAHPAETPAAPQPNAPVNQPANQRNARPPANQNIRMNAQGGPVDDDDEDEFGQRDWLDWVYAMCRFGVLLSIVYFYSTMSRFVIVFLFFLVVYLYEKGWFRLGRREQPDVQQQQPAEQQPQQQQQQQPEAPADPAPAPDLPNEPNENNEQVNGTNPEESEGTDTTTTDESSPIVPDEPRPGVLTILWCFISTFFTSLVPQPPPAINAN